MSPESSRSGRGELAGVGDVPLGLGEVGLAAVEVVVGEPDGHAVEPALHRVQRVAGHRAAGDGAHDAADEQRRGGGAGEQAGEATAHDDDHGGGPGRGPAGGGGPGCDRAGRGHPRGLGHQPLAQGRDERGVRGRDGRDELHEVTAGLDELDEVLVGDALALEGALETVRRTVQYWHAGFSLPSPALIPG